MHSRATARIPCLKEIFLAQMRNSTLLHGGISCKLYQSGITLFYNSWFLYQVLWVNLL